MCSERFIARSALPGANEAQAGFTVYVVRSRSKRNGVPAAAAPVVPPKASLRTSTCASINPA